MTDGKKLRRFDVGSLSLAGLDKIAFLLLLAAGLLFAELIVSSRGNLKLSEPVSLQDRGLTVCVPAGEGTGSFEYNGNEFRFSSRLQISSNAIVSASWRYFLVPLDTNVPERFETQAKLIAGDIEKISSEQFGQFTFDYAKITSQKDELVLFSGMTQLPDGSWLALEVSQKGQIDLAEKLFRLLAGTVTFTPNSPLADGHKLLENFRKQALAEIVQKEARLNYYYIKDYTGKNLGFVTDAVGLRANQRDANALAAAGLYLIRSGINTFAEQTLFRCEPNLQTFKWLCRQSNILINNDLTTSIELDRQGTVTVIRENTGRRFASTKTMLPETIFDTLIESFLQSDFNSVMVDIILPDGQIAPALVTKVETQKINEPNAASAVEIAFAGINANKQIEYFDSSGRILQSFVHGKISYKLERTDKDSLIADFPGWLEKLEQIEQYAQEKTKKD